MTNKSLGINKLIEFLQKKFGLDNIRIKDHWDQEPNAIGFIDISEQFLVYVYITEEKKDQFYVALEGPSSDEEMPYTDMGDFDSINLSELESIVARHLKINV